MSESCPYPFDEMLPIDKRPIEELSSSEAAEAFLQVYDDLVADLGLKVLRQKEEMLRATDPTLPTEQRRQALDVWKTISAESKAQSEVLAELRLRLEQRFPEFYQ